MNYTQPALKAVAVDELIWELKEYWTAKAGKGMFNVNILHLPEDPEKLQLSANKILLTIAFNNIIGNAFKFSANRPVKCELSADEKGITFAISDQGVGILPNELEKIFKSFYRGTNVKDYNGTGIGLYVTQKIIGLFNGSIYVDSTPNSGTRVTVRFDR